MNKRLFILGLSLVIAASATGQDGEGESAPEKLRNDRARGIVLPKSDTHYQQTKDYVEESPDADYLHASEAAHEAFRDIKFSIRIHWGVYSAWGVEASIPYLSMPPEKKAAYNELYKTFNPTGFDAEEWMTFFKRCGMQAFAFTSKHCDGFSMFHTKTRVKQRANYLNPPEQVIEPCDLAYSIEETPFKRDIVKELCDAAHRNGIKVNLYYSHPDWYDADFRPYCWHPLTIDAARKSTDFGPGSFSPDRILTPDPTPEESARMAVRHREQLRELLTNYGKIDMVCLDMWLGRYVWPETRETVKMMRQLQPDVMIRARGIGNYGDYYQPEEFVPQGVENTNMPWMSICLLGNIFAYDPVAEHYKGTPWVVRQLVDCVAKGGSFMVCIGPDTNGKFHPEAVRQLEETGRWLAVNGEGIYDTRAREVWQSDSIWFTQSKDGKRVYAFTEKLPDGQLIVKSVEPDPHSEIHLLGYKKPLEWTYRDGALTIHLPSALRKEANRPCKHMYTFRIHPKSDEAYEKLYGELKKYAVVYDTYNHVNYPVLSGNTAIGGLTDPLGRGVCNIEMNDLYLDEDSRVTGPGMMLKMAQFSGLQPLSYRQSYDLENGILTTDAGYATGAYRSKMCFSQDDRELMVYTLTNLGENNLVCNVDVGQYDFEPVAHTDTTLYGISREGSFITLHYFLQSNIPLNTYMRQYSKDMFTTVPPGKTLEIVLRLKVTPHRELLPLTALDGGVGSLFRRHAARWRELWESMGFVILPEGDYARAFYRSLHWLQCTAGSETHLPGEAQFAAMTSRIAEAYQFHGALIPGYTPWNNETPWHQRPFTYGAAGWSLHAYTWLGDRERAGKMLTAFYRPDALRRNVAGMFPLGQHEFTYGVPKGRYEYLSADNPDALCFAHENRHDGLNHDAPLWDKQVHIQAFGPSLFYHFSRMYGEKTDTAYHVMRGAAEFWRTLLNYDAANKTYTLPPLLSLTEDLFEAGLLDGLIAARWTLAEAAAMAAERNTDEALRKQWLDIARHIRIKDKEGIYLEFDADDGSRAGGGYQGIRGYAYLGFPTLEQMNGFDAKKVNRSLDVCWERNHKGKGMITFIANWFALTDAYWGRAAQAYEKSSYSVTQIDASGTAMCEQNNSLYYFLTGYASFVMAPVSMVLQSVGDEIRVFPAVPAEFADLEFYRLPAVGNLRVSGIRKGGKTQKVWFEKEGKVVLEASGKEVVRATLRNGRPVLN